MIHKTTLLAIIASILWCFRSREPTGNMAPTRVLITGASGLLGRALYKEFKQNEDWEPLGLAFSRAAGELRKVDITDEVAVAQVFQDFKVFYFNLFIYLLIDFYISATSCHSLSCGKEAGYCRIPTRCYKTTQC
jgi:hypothetical protein